MKYSTVIVAAGSGTRMHLGYNKVYAPLADRRTVLEHTMDVFLQDEDCVQIIVVTDAYEYKEKITGRWPGKILIAKGGASRQESVANGLMAVLADYVLIHDGARPFLTGEMIDRCIEGAVKNGAAVAAVPSKDTVKLSDENGFVSETPDRNYVWTIQTPQAFSYPLVLKAHEEMYRQGLLGLTDDASVVERTTGIKVKLVEGSYRNIKITTQEDMRIAAALSS